MVLPIAFASGKIDTIEFGENNFENQNLLLNQLAQTEDVEYFKPLYYSEDSLSDGSTWFYDFTAESSNPVYLRMFGNIGWGTVYIRDEFIGNHFSSETNCNLYLGQFEEDEEVEVICQSDNVSCYDAQIYEMDLDAFSKAYDSLSEGGIEITKQKGSTIEGKITVGKDQMIFTSIPYDDGFTVTVDGKEVEKTVLKMKKDGKKNNVFLTIPAEEGEHTIQITYCPPGFVTGIILAAAALLVAAAYYKSGVSAKLLNRKK